MSALIALLLIGATVRLTRLLTTDYIFESLRCWIERRLPEGVAYMVRCDWCLSVYVGVAVFVAGWYAPDTAVLIVAGALTGSLVAGWSSIVEVAVADND